MAEGVPPAAGAERASNLLRRLRWPVARRLGVHPWGGERSGLRGPGVEYADVREYQYGEDARMIDWNLTARSDRPFVRESNPDRGLDVWLLVDVSRSLDWGTARCLKRELAAGFADAAALLLARYGNRMGAIVFDSSILRILAPASGRDGRLALIARLAVESERPPGPGGTDLALALGTARRLIRRPSLVIVISDFLGVGGWQPPMRALAARHEVVAVRVVDPREFDIPDIGVVTFEDPETGFQVEIDTSNRRLRERFRAAAQQQREAFVRDVRGARATALELTTSEELLRQLAAYLGSLPARRRSADRTAWP